MPLEGQWERQNTPLRRLTGRERRLLIPVMIVTIVACAGLVYLLVAGNSSSAKGCVDVSVPSTMGAGQIHSCGRDAKRLCRSQTVRDDPSARATLEACRNAGLD